MEGKNIVFEEDSHVVMGGSVIPFKAGVPRKVRHAIAEAALLQGGKLSERVVINPIKGEGLRASVALVPVTPPAPKKTRKRRAKKRTDSVIIADAVEYMTANQPAWLEDDYDLNKLPRMILFQGAVPDLTPTLREAAWDIFISGQRDA